MMTAAEEKEIIAEALYCYWSKCVDQSVRKRTICGRQYSFKQMQQKEQVSKQWHDMAKVVKQVLDKYSLMHLRPD